MFGLYICIHWNQYTIYAKYAIYIIYLPVLSYSCEKVKQLFAIVKVRQGSIKATHMPNRKVEHKIVVFSRQSPCFTVVMVFLGFREGRRADVLILLRRPTA